MRVERLFGFSVAAVVVAATAGLIALRTMPEQPARAVPVQIVSLHEMPNGCVQKTAIVFRTEDGRTGEELRRTKETDCRVGDWTTGEAVGASLHLAAGACRKHEPAIGSTAC